MAAWIVWKDTHFFTSHDDVFISISDLQHCLEHKAVESQVQWTQDKTNFLENQALHYLCQNKDLEDLCVFDFYQEYESANLTKKLRDDGDYYEFEKGVGPQRCAPLGQQNGTSLVQKLCACICIRLKRCTIQHGRSDQICFYSETVGPDWSGHAHLQLEVRTRGAEDGGNPSRRHDRYSDQFWEQGSHFAPHVRTCT